MINNGVPQHIVQKFLGHESPEMTARYAHIFDETLKKENYKIKETLVTNNGSIIDLVRKILKLTIQIFNGLKRISMHRHFLMAIVGYQ